MEQGWRHHVVATVQSDVLGRDVSRWLSSPDRVPKLRQLLSSRSSQGYGRLRVAVDTVVPQFVSDRLRHCVHLFFGPFQAVSEKSETYSFDTPVKHWSSQKTKSVTVYDAPVGECLMAIDSTVEEHRNVYLARAVALPGILSTLPISQPQTRGL